MLENAVSLEDKYPARDINSFNPDSTLTWYPSLAPYPFRSSKGLPMVNETDISELALPISEYHCHLFDLTKPAEMTLYETIRQRILDGWYSGINELRKWKDLKPITANTSDEELQNRLEGVLVWMEWTQTYMELPGGINV